MGEGLGLLLELVFQESHRLSPRGGFLSPRPPGLCLSACYEAYRARLGEAKDVMTCTCDACLSIGGLELFVLHHGEYIVQSVAGHQELLGPDVTISHLLLKNHAADLVGQSAYALVTDPAATKLDIPLDGTLPITEEYEHYPPVRASVLALS